MCYKITLNFVEGTKKNKIGNDKKLQQKSISENQKA